MTIKQRIAQEIPFIIIGIFGVISWLILDYIFDNQPDITGVLILYYFCMAFVLGKIGDAFREWKNA